MNIKLCAIFKNILKKKIDIGSTYFGDYVYYMQLVNFHFILHCCITFFNNTCVLILNILFNFLGCIDGMRFNYLKNISHVRIFYLFFY